MRISDWSSDVCSSDLAAVEAPGVERRAQRRDHRMPVPILTHAERAPLPAALCLKVQALHTPVCMIGAAAMKSNAPARVVEINLGSVAGCVFPGWTRGEVGRASGRERGGALVVDWGVAGT